MLSVSDISALHANLILNKAHYWIKQHKSKIINLHSLKGRIASLPIDVDANASFLPDNLLNVHRIILRV
jgi:hypothetical protein